MTQARIALFALLAIGCTTASGGGGGGGAAPTPPPAQAQTRIWPVLTRSHVDLWLHGYAMLLRDTSTVPVFRKGYRDRIQAADRKSTRLNSSHLVISYAVFCLKKKKKGRIR